MPIGDETLKKIVEGVSAAIMIEINQLRREQEARHSAGASTPLADTVPNISVRRLDGASLDVDAALNRWQGLAQSAQGNIQRITKEIQRYLIEGVLPPNKKQ